MCLEAALGKARHLPRDLHTEPGRVCQSNRYRPRSHGIDAVDFRHL
eukprot:SAG31_NODE_36654_length_311_cov_0.976415_1_plen_45_part_10